MPGVQFGADRSGIPTLDDLIAMMNAKRAAALEGAPSLGEAVAGVPARVADAVTQRAQGFGNVAADIGREGFFPWYNRQPPIDKQQLTDAAMGFMPGGIMGKLETGGIRAFHGSPHSFDQFEWSPRTIGTGEGAQAYGHGLYFAQAEDVANQYKSTLSRRNIDVTFDGKPVTDWPSTVDNLEKGDWRLSKLLSDYGRTGGPLPDFVQRMRDWYRGDKPMESALGQFENRVQSKWTPGSMYEVNIAAEPHQLLDWDKPLSEHDPNLQQRLHDAWLAHREDQAGYTGRQIHNSLTDAGDTDAVAANLRDAGIPGIQFLDQGSRNVQLIPPSQTVHGQWLVKQIPNGNVLYRGPDEATARSTYENGPTRNYVIFNPDIIKILRKYGIGGMALPTAGAGLAFGDQGQQ